MGEHIESILEELELDIDDIKWFLATQMATSLLSYQEEPALLARHIWSGKLEAELYRMEERFLEELESKLESGQADREEVMEQMQEVVLENNKRWKA